MLHQTIIKCPSCHKDCSITTTLTEGLCYLHVHGCNNNSFARLAYIGDELFALADHQSFEMTLREIYKSSVDKNFEPTIEILQALKSF